MQLRKRKASRADPKPIGSAAQRYPRKSSRCGPDDEKVQRPNGDVKGPNNRRDTLMRTGAVDGHSDMQNEKSSSTLEQVSNPSPHMAHKRLRHTFEKRVIDRESNIKKKRVRFLLSDEHMQDYEKNVKSEVVTPPKPEKRPQHSSKQSMSISQSPLESFYFPSHKVADVRTQSTYLPLSTTELRKSKTESEAGCPQKLTPNGCRMRIDGVTVWVRHLFDEAEIDDIRRRIRAGRPIWVGTNAKLGPTKATHKISRVATERRGRKGEKTAMEQQGVKLAPSEPPYAAAVKEEWESIMVRELEVRHHLMCPHGPLDIELLERDEIAKLENAWENIETTSRSVRIGMLVAGVWL
ncbi:MAG: hypothetical protein M1818_004745 [Claussenomyces sp. TS43310]|nr:MAG: hypothetical protein M1818_004745 [Claussenomyces sp. TS43310]